MTRHRTTLALASCLCLGLTACGEDASDPPLAPSSSSGETSSSPTSDTVDGSSTTGADTSTSTPTTSADSTGGAVDSGSDDSGATTDPGDSTGDPVAENLLFNPSLEAWATAAEVNSYPDGWQECGGESLGLEAVPDSCDATPATAADGTRYARGVLGESLGQVIETESGATYTVTLQTVGVEGCFGGGADSTWEVFAGNTRLGATSGDALEWESTSFDFVATGPTTGICFRKGQFTRGLAGGIDDLSVMRQ